MKIARHYTTMTLKALEERKAREEEAANKQLARLEKEIEEAAKKGHFKVTLMECLSSITLKKLADLGYVVVDKTTKGRYDDPSNPCFEVDWTCDASVDPQEPYPVGQA